ncbi:hypothetical protein EDB80DRAFT_236825, partial [Ilyonectria destructans]
MKRSFESTQTEHIGVAEQSETTPWLQHTRWPELFRNRPLDVIAASAQQPGPVKSEGYLLGHWQGCPLWSSSDTEAQLRIILHGLDLMFDRARVTLDRTPYTSRCWLNTYSKDAFWPYGFRVIPSFKRYLAIWKRFICFVFRVLQYPTRQRREVFNLRLGSNEVKMMQHVLYLARQLQLARDDVSDDSDASDREYAGEEWHEGGNDSDSDTENTETGEDTDEDTDEDADENMDPGETEEM